MSWEVFKGSENKKEKINFFISPKLKRRFFVPIKFLKSLIQFQSTLRWYHGKKIERNIYFWNFTKKILKMPSFVLTDVWPLRTGDGDNNVVEFGSQWWWWIGLKLARKFKLHRSKPIIHMKFWWRLRLMNTSNLFGKKKNWKCDNKNQWVGKNVAGI